MTSLFKIQNGEEEYLEQLIQLTYPKIYSYILRKLKDVTVTKDVTQETYLKFMKHLYELPSDTKIENYLYRIAYHLCIDYFRIYHRTQEEIEIQSHEKQPIEVVLEQEKASKIQHAISCLSEEQQDVILLRYYQDLKIKEIAYILNEKESTIKTRLRLGTKKLKTILGGDRDEYEKGTK